MKEINKKDLLVMKLIHYFMIEKDYVPIIIRGIDNEVWLENPKGEFRIIRIVTKNIFNNEQYEFDSFKTKNIVTQIMKQTFNSFIDVLTIYTEIGDNFKNKFKDTKKYKYIILEKEEDIEKNELLIKYYKDINKIQDYKENDSNLIGRLASEISQKNIDDNERYNAMFEQKKPIITYSLIATNIIIFILMYIFGNGSEDTNTLIKFGANMTPLIKGGEYYRLLTSAFLHIGIVHLLCNMYSLYVLGPTIEHYFGRVKFLIIYLYSAIIGSLFTIIFQSANSISAGASGAIFGLLGTLLYFCYSYRGHVGKSVVNQVIPIILINLFIGFSFSGISNAAHIGGLIGGVVMAFTLGVNSVEENQNKSRRINGIIITTILTAFIIYMSFFR